MALSTDTKLFGLDLSAAAGQLRAAWGQLMGLPLLRRSLPAALVRVVKADGGLAHAWVRAGQWHWAVEREASGRKPSGSAVLMGGDQLLLRTLRMPSLSAQALHGAVALDVQTMSPFPALETLWAYVVATDPAGGQRVELVITSNALVQQALRDAAGQLAGQAQPEIWASTSIMPVLLAGFGEGPRLARESRQRRWIGAGLAAIVAAGLALAITPTAKLYLQAVDASRKFDQIVRETREVTAQRQGLVTGVEEIAALQKLQREQINHLQVMAALTQLFPDDTAVQRVSFSGSKLAIQGLSSNASNVVQLMSKAPGFLEVRMPSAVTRASGSNKESYTVEAVLDPKVFGVLASPEAEAQAAPDATSETPETPAAAEKKGTP